MEIGLNPELIAQGSGVDECYGIYQQQVQVIRISKKDLIYNLI